MQAFLDATLKVIQTINAYLSDYILIFLLIGIGLFYTVRTRFVQIRCFGEGMKKPFTDEVFGIIQQFFFDGYVIYFMCDVFGLAQRCDIELMWFVNEKMKYNETREVLHGKEY